MSRMIMNLKGLGALSIPRVFFNMQLISKLNALKKLKNYEILHIKNRLNYYNKINDFFELKKIENVEHSKLGENLLKNTSYSFDFYKVSKYFHKDLKINKFFYDCSSEFLNTITKSRPIDSKNVILKLDSRRHFCFLNDKNDFKDKVDLAVFRGACVQQNRIDFINKFKDCKRLNLGNVNKKNGGGVFKQGRAA